MPLSPRQSEILILTAQGKTSRAIGIQMNLAEQTVKTHKTEILRRLDAETMTQAVYKYFMGEGNISSIPIRQGKDITIIIDGNTYQGILELR